MLTEEFSWRGREVRWERMGSGPNVVFCHGTPWSSELWRPAAEAAWITVAVVLTIARLLSAELQATGQALFQTLGFGVSAIVANVVGGLLYDRIGHGAVFGLGASLAAAAAVLGWFAFPPERVRERAVASAS